MESKPNKGAQLEKITNRAWRTWWFLFYLLIIPATVALVSFFLTSYLTRNAYFAVNLTTILTLASFFIVYKLFDRYLEAPILRNNASNASFRVHAPFFFSMVALVSAFVILIFTVEQQLFRPLPIIALGVVYSFTWLYYRWKPIDQLDYAAKAFKHASTLEGAARCFHNVVVFFHLAFQGAMISFYMDDPLLWGGIGIPINVGFWIAANRVTASTRKMLQGGLLAGNDVAVHFATFKKQFAHVMIAACASFMIIIIFYPLIVAPGLLDNFSWFMLFLYGLVIAGVLLVKAEAYVAIHFNKQINALSGSEHFMDGVASRLNKASIGATAVLIATSFVMGFVPGIPAATPITVAAVYAMVLGERRAKLAEGWWYSLSHLANTVCLVASISFGVLPSLPQLQIPAIIQVTVFIVSLYVTVECYCALNYFKKHALSGLQDAMAIGSLSLVAYSCFGLAFTAYVSGAGITSAAGMAAAGVFVAILLSGIVATLSCYRLYKTRWHGRTNRRVKVVFGVAFVWTVTAITGLVMAGQRLPITLDAVNIIGRAAIWWAGAFMLYVTANTMPGIYFQKDAIDSAYRSTIVFIATIPALVIYNFPSAGPVLAATAAITVMVAYHLKWGVRLGRVKSDVHEKYLRAARPLLASQMLAMQLGWYLAAGLDPLLAAYIAVVVTAGISTLFMKTDLFKKNVSVGIDVAALLFTSLMIFKGLCVATWGTPYVFSIPLLLAALFAFIPFYLMAAFSWWSKATFSRVAFSNSLAISALVLSLPTSIMVDVEARFFVPVNVFADLFYSLLLALGVFFAFTGALERLGVKPSHTRPFRCGTVVAMAGISVFGAFTLFNLATRVASTVMLPAMVSLSLTSFLAMNFITIAILRGHQLAPTNVTTTMTRITYFAFAVSLSTFLTQLVVPVYPVTAFPVDLGALGISWYALFFAMFALFLSSLPRLVLPAIKLHAIERGFTAGCWTLLSVFGCMYMAGILGTGTLLGFGTLFAMLLACTAPVTRYFLRHAGMKASTRERGVGTAAKYAFLGASLAFLLERARLAALLPTTGANPLLYILLLANIAGYACLFAAMMGNRATRFSGMMACSLVLVLALAFLPTLGGIVCVVAAAGATARAGSTSERIRWIRTALLSAIAFSAVIWFHGPPPGGFVQPHLVQIHAIEYTACLFVATVYAIATTEGKKSVIEGNVASVLGSLLVFQLLIAFTPTSTFHSTNLTLIVYLSLLAAHLNRAGSVKQFVALKALSLTVVVYLTTSICSLAFNRPGLGAVNITMNFLATYSAVAFIIIRFFKPFMLRHRKHALVPMLAAFNVFVPVFAFLLFTHYAVVPIDQSILALLCVDLGFFLCFLSIGVFRWELTRNVWKVGWWLWLAFPIVNFQLVFDAVVGVDVIKGLNLFALGDIPGSMIVTLIIVSAMYLPIVRYKIQRYFYQAMLVFWGENLLAIGWAVQNLFPGSLPLATLGFLVIGFGMLLPLLYKWRAWRAMATAWSFLAVSNVLFMHLLLTEAGTAIGFIVSIELIVTSFLGMLYCAIPKSPARWPVLVASYASLLAGLWSFVYFTMYEVTKHAFISVNIAFIAIAFSLFSSRFLKVSQAKARALIALILMVNLSLLAVNTLSLIPGMLLVAIFAGISVFGGSFYTMNQYKMVFHVDKRVPWSILGIGSALSASSLVVSAWQAPPMIVGFVFSLIAVIFFYKDVPVQAKAALVPIPPTFLAGQLFVTLLPGQVLVDALLFSTCYLALLQCVANAGARIGPARPSGVDGPPRADGLPRFNLAIFTANSVQVSTVAAMLLAAPVVFSLALPFLLICCQSFAIRKRVAGKATRAGAFMTAVSSVLHASIAASIMVLLPIPSLSTPLPPELAGLLAKATVFSTSMFVQLAWLDMAMFKIMAARARFALMVLTYALAFNFIATYLFLNHHDPSLLALSLFALNILTAHLWQLASPTRTALARKVKILLYNGVLASGALFASRWAAFEPLLAVDPTGVASWLAYLTLAFLLMALLNLLINRTLQGRAYLAYQLCLFTAFQAFLSLSWARLLPVLGPVGLVSIAGLAIAETWLSLVPYQIVTRGLLRKAASRRSASPLALLIYIETSFMAYAGSALVLGTVESVLIGLGCMFVITLVEFHGIKCVKPAITWGLNLASFLPFMVSLLLTWKGHLPVAGPVGLVSILGLILVETGLGTYPYHVVRHRFFSRPMARPAFAVPALMIYLEFSLFAYASSALFLSARGSVLASFGILFLLTLLDVHVVKFLKARIGYGLNLASYIPFMAAFFIGWIEPLPLGIEGLGLLSLSVLV
ncbi:MAG: hypothetical protein JW839_08015, partial [Candidatus Lokiarchaeota archaeon]|nr:hypothetical protein [Candidatus Lokiarchaeota archaeon]